jgi:transcriptional regulator with XRE-family HTH domain
VELRLREWRTKRGLSLRRLAEKAAVSFVTLYRIEGGKISPTVALLEKLAGPLRITVRDFFPVEAKPRRARRSL